MSVCHHIDPELGLVFGVVSGNVTLIELVKYERVMPLKLKVCHSLDEALKWLALDHAKPRILEIKQELAGKAL